MSKIILKKKNALKYTYLNIEMYLHTQTYTLSKYNKIHQILKF